MNRSNALLAIAALMLGLNLGYMIASKDSKIVPVLPTARAGTVAVTSSGEIFTASQEGDRLYQWYNSRNNAPGDAMKAVVHKP